MAHLGREPHESDLGAYIARLRTAVGLTLRQVEEATNREVSNAYLSQLENGKINKPSPNILFALATVYGVEYEDLMTRAGYFPSAPNTEGRRQARVATFAIDGITPEEERELLDYLAYIRRRRDDVSTTNNDDQ